MKDNFNKYIGFVPKDSLDKSKGQRVDLPKSLAGYMVAQRRHIFFFWQKECLIQQETSDGVFFTWIKKSNLEFEYK